MEKNQSLGAFDSLLMEEKNQRTQREREVVRERERWKINYIYIVNFPNGP